MNDRETETLIRVAQRLEEAARLLRDIAGEKPAPSVPRRKPIPGEFVESLRTGDRQTAATRLADLSQRELGQVFAQLGGPSRDRKRGKDWLVERILWHLFDFQAGHDIIRR